MIHARIVGGRISVVCPSTWNDVVKRIPGALYHNGGWTVPLAWPACLQLRDEFGENLIIEQDLAHWAHQYLAHREQIMQAQSGAFTADGLDPRLRPKQALGATWLAWAGRCMLLDEMRSGKTPQMIEALEAVGDAAFPALIICPSTNRWIWADEFTEWAPDVLALPLHGTAAQRRKTLEQGAAAVAEGRRVVITTNWESLRGLSRLEGYGSVALSDKEKEEGPLNTFGFATVIADEAHRALDPHSKQTRALWYLMHHAARRYVLTATPVSNNGGDLWSLWFSIAPEEAPVRTKWLERYTDSGQGMYGWEIRGFRAERQEEMFAALDPRILRRTMREVREGMPDRLPVEVRRAVLEGPQEKVYRALKKHMLASLPTETGGEGVLVVSDPLTLVGRLSFAAAATPVLDDEGNVTSLTTPSVKVDTLLEVLTENPGEPLVVFAVSRKLLVLCEEQLEKAKISFVGIHGGVDPALRAANIARFQGGHVQVALCTYGAGAEGVTLNRAYRTLFLQVTPSMVQWVQASARTDGRPGGEPIETLVHICSETIESRFLDIIEGKKVILEELLRDELRQAGP